jgi:hypothetical protein
MNWTASLKVASAKPTTNKRRATWATPEQRAHRQANNLCLQCRLSEHYTNDCDLAKPSRLANLKASRIDEETSNAAESMQVMIQKTRTSHSELQVGAKEVGIIRGGTQGFLGERA